MVIMHSAGGCLGAIIAASQEVNEPRISAPAPFEDSSSVHALAPSRKMYKGMLQATVQVVHL